MIYQGNTNKEKKMGKKRRQADRKSMQIFVSGSSRIEEEREKNPNENDVDISKKFEKRKRKMGKKGKILKRLYISLLDSGRLGIHTDISQWQPTF